MSARFTAVYLQHGAPNATWAERGRRDPAEMIKLIRQRAAKLKAEAELVLAAKDEDFFVTTYVGAYVRRKHEVLQEGRR